MKYPVKLIVKNASLFEEINKILRKDPEFHVLAPNAGLMPYLIIIELSRTDDQALQQIETILKSRQQATELFVLANSSDSALLMRLMRMGVKEFFPLPFQPEEFEAAIERFKTRIGPVEQITPKKSGQIISVVGSKGGVGTTTVAVNLAVTLAQLDKNNTVCLLDLNTLFGDTPLFLDLTPKYHWGEITKNIDRLDDMFLMNVLSKHSSGVHLLPSPAYLNGHIAPSPKIIDVLLGLMRTMFDFVVVDGGQSLGDSTLRTLQISDSTLLIAVLSMPCLSNTNRLLKSFFDLGYVSRNQVKVVINRYLKKSEISLKDAAEGIGSEIFWTIPNDYTTTITAINQGKPVSQMSPNSLIAKSLLDMTHQMLPQPEKKAKKGWRLFDR
jgi:pilus assembly protein CpaE